MKIATIIFYDLKMYMQNIKALLFTTFLLVITLSIIYFTVTPLFQKNGFIDRFKIAVVNLDNSTETRLLVQQFEESDAIKRLTDVLYMDYDEAMSMLESDKISAAIVIPEDFSRNIAHGNNMPVSVVGNPKRPLQSQLIKAMMTSSANLVSAAQSGVITVYSYLYDANAPQSVLDRVYGNSVISFSLRSLGRNEVFKKRVVSSTADITPVEYFSISAFIFYILLSGSIGLKPVIEDRNSRIMHRIVSQGTSVWEIVGAKFLALFIFLLLHFSLLAGGLLFFIREYFYGDVFAVFMVLASVIAASAAISLLAASCTKTLYTGAMTLSSIVMIMAFTGGGVIPLAYLPESVEALSAFSIHKWAIYGFVHAFFNNSLYTASSSSMVLFIFTALVLLASGMIITHQQKNFRL